MTTVRQEFQFEGDAGAEQGGFAIIPNWVARGAELDAFEKLVYMALLSRANDYGYTWPSMATLSRDAGCSERTVRDRLRKLEERGLVMTHQRTREDGGITSNMYRVETFRPGTERRPPRQGMPPPSAPVAAEEEPLEEEPLEDRNPIVPLRDFKDFYLAYPRKVGKQAALKAWAKALKLADPETIIQGAERFAADPNLPTDKQFIPHPSTWLNAGRWDDESLPPRVENSSGMSALARNAAAFEQAFGGGAGGGSGSVRALESGICEL